MYRGCGVVKSTRKMVMSLAGIILFSIWVSLCVAVIGGWAFKTLDDDVIPNWDAWAKAGYSDESTETWYVSPAQSQSQMTGGTPGEDDGNKGNCNSPVFILYEVGAYTLSVSPSGTFDQGGNVVEWSEAIAGGGGARRFPGASFSGGCNGTVPNSGPFGVPVGESGNRGFRVARLTPMEVPMLDALPMAGLFAMLTVVGLALVRDRADSPSQLSATHINKT